MTLAELAIQEYNLLDKEFIPLYPAVLLRVLPKKLVTDSGIVLPAGEDKHLYEGIVLRTWKDRIVIKNGKTYQLTCPLGVGDHVMFPHWSGEPVKGLDDQEYRMVPARDYFSTVGSKDAGEIVLIVNNYQEDVRDELVGSLVDVFGKDLEGLDKKVTELLDTYDIIRKIKTSVTR